jgi:hypothetical protein
MTDISEKNNAAHEILQKIGEFSFKDRYSIITGLNKRF